MHDLDIAALASVLAVAAALAISLWGQPLPSLAAAVIVTVIVGYARRYSRPYLGCTGQRGRRSRRSRRRGR